MQTTIRSASAGAAVASSSSSSPSTARCVAVRARASSARPSNASSSPRLPAPPSRPAPLSPPSLRSPPRRASSSSSSSSPFAARATAVGDIDPDNASVLVAGGGGVALSVARRLKDAGAWVWMLQRSDVRRPEIEKMMAVVVRGDATSKEDVEKAFAQIEEVDLVVSTIGGTPADPRADSEGNINLIEAAAAKGVKRFVLVTSIGCGASRDAPPAQVYDVLKPVLLEKDKAEAALVAASKRSGMEYVIVRPGGLSNEQATGSAVLTEDAAVCGAVAREDVAALVAAAALKGSASGRTLSAVDTSQLFEREGSAPKFEVFSL